jgi:hypothetical protein
LLNDQSGLVLSDSTVFSWTGCHTPPPYVSSLSPLVELGGGGRRPAWRRTTATRARRRPPHTRFPCARSARLARQCGPGAPSSGLCGYYSFGACLFGSGMRRRRAGSSSGRRRRGTGSSSSRQRRRMWCGCLRSTGSWVRRSSGSSSLPPGDDTEVVSTPV